MVREPEVAATGAAQMLLGGTTDTSGGPSREPMSGLENLRKEKETK